MLEYKIRKKKEREGGMGRINLEIPMQDLRDIKLLAVKWRCAGVDAANVSNFVRIAVKRFLENSDVNKFKEEMKK